MVSFTSLALLGLAAGALAAPAEKRWSGDCMTGAEAQQVADNYAELIRDYSDELAIDARPLRQARCLSSPLPSTTARSS